MNHGRKQHDSHIVSKTYKQRQVCKVNSQWALARHQLFPSQSGRLVVVQCGALLGLDLLGLVLGLLDLALSSLALGSLALGSWLLGLTLLWLLGLGLVELVLEVVLVEHSGFLQWSWWPSWQSAHKSISQLQGCWIIYPTSLQAADANVYPGTAVATTAARKPGLATAVATAVAGGHSGCREEKHFNHLV